jgi:hypothetical protein
MARRALNAHDANKMNQIQNTRPPKHQKTSFTVKIIHDIISRNTKQDRTRTSKPKNRLKVKSKNKITRTNRIQLIKRKKTKKLKTQKF